MVSEFSVAGFFILLSSYLAESNLVPGLLPTRGAFFFFYASIWALLHCSYMLRSSSSMFEKIGEEIKNYKRKVLIEDFKTGC